MKDYEAKRQISKNINEILIRLYNNVHPNYFDENVDFSSIPSTVLKDFWLYTAGFIGFNNNDKLESLVSEKEVQSILAGKFVLKYLTQEQLDVLAKRSNITFSDSDKPQKVKIYTIQDGTYYLNKNTPNKETGELSNFVSLETCPVELHTDTPQDYVEPKFVLKLLRNTFAHESPYIRGNRLTFLKQEDEIVVTKMWLRGFTELFARKTAPYNSSEINSLLTTYLQDSQNTLSSIDEIYSAIESIKKYLPEEISSHIHLTKFLIYERINLEKNFYKKDFEERKQSLCSILTNNLSMFSNGYGTTNSNLLYGLINLAGIELQNRKEEADLDDQDPEVIEFANIISELKNLQRGASIIKSLKSMQGNGRTLKRNIERQSYLTKEADRYLKIINPKKTLECAHMDYQTIEDMKHLPIETAVNIVYLMAYNSLVSSGIYEQTLRYSNFQEFNQEQNDFFCQFDFGKIADNSMIPGKKDKPGFSRHPGRKAFLLYCMRNAISHGNVKFTYPKINELYKPDFRNVRLKFNAVKQNVTVSGSLKDFYNLFSSPAFTQERTPELITTFDRQAMNEAKDRRRQRREQYELDHNENFSTDNDNDENDDNKK